MDSVMNNKARVDSKDNMSSLPPKRCFTCRQRHGDAQRIQRIRKHCKTCRDDLAYVVGAFACLPTTP